MLYDDTLFTGIAAGGQGHFFTQQGLACGPLQFIRELTQNAIEAHIRTGRQGKIFWDYDPFLYKTTGVKKLCIIDTGVGMSKAELISYINSLAATGGNLGTDSNYGIGAKISTATFNPVGVIYQSWKNGEGHMIHYWRGPSGGFGLKRLNPSDEENAYVVKLPIEFKPKEISDAGTKIILLGESENDDTTAPKPDWKASMPSKWIHYCLNNRYFKFPEGVDVKSREGYNHVETQDPKSFKLRTVKGTQKWLEDNKICSGHKDLEGGIAYWWILKPKAKVNPAKDTERATSSERYDSGHIASLWKDELYDFKSGKAGNSLLREFGIIYGTTDVVIYIEPILEKLTTDPARTILKTNNTSLPWSEWAEEFRSSLPKELEDYENQFGKEHAKNVDIEKEVRDLLKTMSQLWSIQIFKHEELGDQGIETPSIGGSRTRETDEPASPPKPTPGKNVPRPIPGNAFSRAILKDSIVKGTTVDAKDDLPKVHWIENPKEVDLEGLAGRYIKGTHVIQMNAKFSGFQDFVNKLLIATGKNDERTKAMCIKKVQKWYQLTVLDLYQGVRSLQKAEDWSQDEVLEALSERAITGVCMQRYFQSKVLKRELGSELGIPLEL